MRLHDLYQKNSSKNIAKVMESYFGSIGDISAVSLTKIPTMLRKIQSTLVEFKNSSDFHASEKNPSYLKLLMVEQALRQRLKEYAGASNVPSAPTTSQAASTSVAKGPAPRPQDIQQKARNIKDPVMRDMLSKAAQGQDMDQEEVKRLAAFAADNLQEDGDKEYTIKYVDEADEWVVVDQVGNWVESFIEKHEAVQKAKELNAKANRPKSHRHVNYRADESTGVTDFDQPSRGGTRQELIAKYARSKKGKDAEAARQAGATQEELRAAREEYELKAARASRGYFESVNESSGEYRVRHNKEDDLWDVVDELGNVIDTKDNRIEAMRAIKDMDSPSSSSKRSVSGTYGKTDIEEGNDGPRRRVTDETAIAVRRTINDLGWVIYSSARIAGDKTYCMSVVLPYLHGKRLWWNDPDDRIEIKKMAAKSAKKLSRELEKRGIATSKVTMTALGGGTRGCPMRVAIDETEPVSESKRPGTSRRRKVMESDVQQAQLVLASQEIVDELQKMIENLSSTQFKDLPALVTQIRMEIGVEQSAQYNQSVSSALQTLIQAVQEAKVELENASGIVTGEGVAELPIAAGDEPDLDDVAPEVDTDDDLGDLDLEKATSDITGLGRERRK